MLAALSGALYVLGYAGFDVWPLAFVALVPVLVAVARLPLDRPGLALRVGLLFGAVVQLAGYRFLVSTLHEFSGLPLPICLVVFGLLSAFEGGQYALFVLFAFAARRAGRAWLALSAFGFAAAEYAYPQLFPSPLAASLHGVPRLLQPLELFGPTGMSLLIALANAAVAAVVLQLRSAPRRTPKLAYAAAAAWTLVLVFGAVRVPQVQARIARAPKLRVGIVQANLGAWQKREDPKEGRRRHIEQSLQLERGVRPDLLIWPETALQSPVSAASTSLAPYLEPLRTPLLVGAVAHRSERGRGHLYNSAFLVDAQGRVLGRADKIELVPFGEYIPLGDRFPALYDLSRGSGQLSPGGGLHALPLGESRIGALICYEDILSRHVRRLVAAVDPHLLVDITNDAWFGRSHAPEQHLALSTLRAIEHRRYLARASNSGPSAVVDPLGRVVTEAPLFERRNLHAEVALMRGRTPFAHTGDLVGPLALLVCVLARPFAGRSRSNMT